MPAHIFAFIHSAAVLQLSTESINTSIDLHTSFNTINRRKIRLFKPFFLTASLIDSAVYSEPLELSLRASPLKSHVSYLRGVQNPCLIISSTCMTWIRFLKYTGLIRVMKLSWEYDTCPIDIVLSLHGVAVNPITFFGFSSFMNVMNSLPSSGLYPA